MRTLYNITTEHQNLISRIEEADGEITPEIEQSLALTQESFEVKAAGYGYVIKMFDDETELITKEIDRLKVLKKQSENKAEWLRSKIKQAMIAFDVKEVKLNNIKISLRKSEQLLITDESAIPDDFKRVVPETKEPDKPKIKAELKAGGFILGCEIIENQNLLIK